MLRASSSRPHVPTPPNLISEALFPVAQMAPRTPKRSTSEGLRALCHIWHPVGWWQRLRGGEQGGKRAWKKVSREGGEALLSARLPNVTGERWMVAWASPSQSPEAGQGGGREPGR